MKQVDIFYDGEADAWIARAAKQVNIFYDGEADAWIARNRDKPRDNDPVMEALDLAGIAPKRLLEIGCGDGWRVKKIRDKYPGCTAYGIDPAANNVVGLYYGAIGDIPGRVPVFESLFDTIVIGFCLYLVDREDLFQAVANTDRLLADGGHLLIHDFAPPRKPFAVPYEHHEGVLSYHMDYAKLWLAHPWYQPVMTVHPENGGDDMVTVLRKDIGAAFPIRSAHAAHNTQERT